MRKIALIFLFMCLGMSSLYSQTQPFVTTVYNDTYSIYIKMNLYDRDITIPGQDYLGEMAGYLGDEKDFRKWYILDVEIVSANKAILSITNDEGSEDLEAELCYDTQNRIYTLTQKDGSVLKIARNRKWVKLPKQLTFKPNK